MVVVAVRRDGNDHLLFGGGGGRGVVTRLRLRVIISKLLCVCVCVNTYNTLRVDSLVYMPFRVKLTWFAHNWVNFGASCVCCELLACF